MSVNTYAGLGWLTARGVDSVAVTVTFVLSGTGANWNGRATPVGEGAVFPAWIREDLVVTLRLAGSGTGQAQVGYVSLDRRQPVPLHGIGPWPG